MKKILSIMIALALAGCGGAGSSGQAAPLAADTPPPLTRPCGDQPTPVCEVPPAPVPGIGPQLRPCATPEAEAAALASPDEALCIPFRGA